MTPAHNVAPWIGETIDSVLQQTDQRFSYIVVDDGSTDNTNEIVAAKAAEDPRIRLISTPNGGSGQARNIALAEAKTPFVAFIDGDDRWHKDFLRHQLDAMRIAPAGVGATFCHTRVMLESGQVVGMRFQPTGLCDLDRMLVDNNPTHNGSSLLIRRSCFNEAGLFNPELASCVDFDMWLRIATRSSTPLFSGIRRYLVDMRLMRTGSISSNRCARYATLDQLIGEFAPTMRRLHPGLAYVRPAVFAYRDGYDDYGDRWTEEARKAGHSAFTNNRWGQSLYAWNKAGPTGRAKLRSLRDTARTGIYKGISQAAATLMR
ncbi:glycosyltransferase family 2 protein [Pseudonocardia sp. GCM10023141]|uniref:glycosyltransferase family 2 protein n=1 Tax=Pseudonocardia sp. GCM10023141 TaxID=3252653 RepID=UPI0036209FCF